MKTKILTLAFVAIAIGWWGSVEASPRGGKMRAHLIEALDLDQSQQDQLAQLHEQTKAEREAQRASGERPSREDRAAQRAAHREAFEAILTADQLAQLEAFKAEAGERGHRGRRGHRGGKMRAHLIEALDLDQAQQDQLAQLRRENREAFKANFTDGQRPTQEQIDAMRQARRQALESVLNPEQLQKLAELKGTDTAESSLSVPNDESVPTAVEEETWGRIKSERHQDKK